MVFGSIGQRLRQRIRERQSSKVTIEDSIWLRVFVQTLVIVGIIATDVAAETQMSIWAVPLSILAGVWSSYRRRQRDIWMKFLLGIGMLVALFAFFGRLFQQQNDTRLVLAELLIQVQILHSFDLPRRQDLGYSMVIGLILLGVAGTLSQTLAFAPLLLIFLAIALPTLVLDYRSRLGLSLGIPSKTTPTTGKSVKIPNLLKLLTGDLSPKRLGVFLLVIVSLGLGIFALLPRFPSYQIQTLPVSSGIQLDRDFQAGSIINPGYGDDGGTDGSGSGDGTDGSGEVDDTFYYGFNTRINQNLRGQMKPKVVMRVRSQSPGFWRALAFDQYTGQGWEISRNEEVEEIDRPSWTYRFLIPPLRRYKVKDEAVVQTYVILADLPNIIPALANPEELYFPTPTIELDPEGSLRAPVNLADGLTYSVVSEVPYRDRTALGSASTNYPKSIQQYYLQVPPEILPRIRQFTEEILETRREELKANSRRAGNDPSQNPKLESAYEQALYLAQYLKQRYAPPANQPDLPFLTEDEDLVSAFLFDWKWGYPDHYSTVLTIMLRSIGIPARLVAGFGQGQFNPFTGYYIVRNTDAYAMTEVYFPEYGWFAFDPIPGHDLIPPSIEENQTFGVLRQFWQWVAGWLPSPVTGFLQYLFRGIFTIIFTTFGWLFGLLAKGWIGIFTFLISLSGFCFFLWISWTGFKGWRYQRFLKKLPPIARLYQQMLDWLAVKGYRKSSVQTPYEYAQMLREHFDTEDAEAIEEISTAYVSYRYGGVVPNDQELRRYFKGLKARHSRKPL
jgi:transglutaminase-like putative cysteine protease